MERLDAPALDHTNSRETGAGADADGLAPRLENANIQLSGRPTRALHCPTLSLQRESGADPEGLRSGKEEPVAATAVPRSLPKEPSLTPTG